MKQPNISNALRHLEGLTPEGKSAFHSRVGSLGGTANKHISGGFKDTALASRAGKLGGKQSGEVRRAKALQEKHKHAITDK